MLGCSQSLLFAEHTGLYPTSAFILEHWWDKLYYTKDLDRTKV